MPDLLHQLYSAHVYPAMSHPLSDPAMSAVAARMAGLKTAHPAKARILEIGCCSGHNLLPLAMRWPESEFVGIDLAERSIEEAQVRAATAGIGNVTFHAADLLNFKPPGEGFDFIIAHGFLSWVPDEVKTALFHFCRENLTPSGIATISFNLEAGWNARFPVIEKVRAIQQFGGGDLVASLAILRTVTEPESAEMTIIDDMLAKGPAILMFDDFGPVNDPWSFDHFVKVAARAGLRWLGETDPAANIPHTLADELVEDLAARFLDPLDFQVAIDQAAARTFRSCILCRQDAPVDEEILLNGALEFSARAGVMPCDENDFEIWQAINHFAPASVSLREVAISLPEWELREFVGRIFEGITCGWILPRIESVGYDSASPEFPCLNPFRLLCARNHLPLVDVWHKPCQFPEGHYAVLEAMDGKRSRTEIAELSKRVCPELVFEPWLKHLANRGMFS